MLRWIVGGQDQVHTKYEIDADNHLEIILALATVPDPARGPNQSDRVYQQENDTKQTQRELQELAQLPETLVSQYESGHRVPSLQNAIKLADALGVSLDWLVGR